VRLRVDGDVCTGHGRCYTVAPSLLTYDDEGFVSIRDETIDVPADQVKAAEDAAASCPEEAISLIEEVEG
jgi:ferredoxin